MDGKWMLAAGILAAFSAGMVATAHSFDGGQEAAPAVPRYSETCPHGRNGFDCKAPGHADDVAALEQRVADLEMDVERLKRR